jgi:5-methylcytosine-specific restriction protein A
MEPPSGRIAFAGVPMTVAKLCRAPGCDDLACPDAPYCADCGAERAKVQAVRRQSAKRGSDPWSHLYQTPEWKRASRAFRKANPLCASCAGIGLVVPVAEVDHKEPHRGNRALFWDRTNWQGLCKPCHSRKTAAEVLHRR